MKEPAMTQKEKSRLSHEILSGRDIEHDDGDLHSIEITPIETGHLVEVRRHGQDPEKHGFNGENSGHEVAELVRRTLHPSDNQPGTEHGFSAPTTKPGSSEPKPRGQFERY